MTLCTDKDLKLKKIEEDINSKRKFEIKAKKISA